MSTNLSWLETMNVFIRLGFTEFKIVKSIFTLSRAFSGLRAEQDRSLKFVWSRLRRAGQTSSRDGGRLGSRDGWFNRVRAVPGKQIKLRMVKTESKENRKGQIKYLNDFY